MARSHFWSFLVNDEGQPIEDAEIWVYLAGTLTPAELYNSESSYYSAGYATFQSYKDANEALDYIEIIRTDSVGYFEFWIGNATETNGYAVTQKFKLGWYKAGITESSIDYMNIVEASDGQGLNWMGEWALDTDYVEYDLVSTTLGSLTSSYICTLYNTSSTDTFPGSGATWNSYWDLYTTGALGGDRNVVYNNSDVTINPDIDTSMNTIWLVDNAAAVDFNLPSIDATSVGKWIQVHKMGIGNLTINAADADVIEDSGAGGNVANTTAAQTYATISLFVATATIWKFENPPLGTWTTT